MSVLCRLGLHRWGWRAERHGRQIWTYARCRRHSCRRYSEWMVVDVEPYGER